MDCWSDPAGIFLCSHKVFKRLLNASSVESWFHHTKIGMEPLTGTSPANLVPALERGMCLGLSAEPYSLHTFVNSSIQPSQIFKSLSSTVKLSCSDASGLQRILGEMNFLSAVAYSHQPAFLSVAAIMYLLICVYEYGCTWVVLHYRDS